MICEHEDKIFSVDKEGFENLALEIFRFQYHHNPVYQQYVNTLSGVGEGVNSIRDIPFLPIGLFKTHIITTTHFHPEAVFESSGTTKTVNSRHLVRDIAIYRESFMRAWQLFYG